VAVCLWYILQVPQRIGSPDAVSGKARPNKSLKLGKEPLRTDAEGGQVQPILGGQHTSLIFVPASTGFRAAMICSSFTHVPGPLSHFSSMQGVRFHVTAT